MPPASADTRTWSTTPCAVATSLGASARPTRSTTRHASRAPRSSRRSTGKTRNSLRWNCDANEWISCKATAPRQEIPKRPFPLRLRVPDGLEHRYEGHNRDGVGRAARVLLRHRPLAALDEPRVDSLVKTIRYFSATRKEDKWA